MNSAQHTPLHIPVRIKKLHDDVLVPQHKRPGDAGMDLHSREDHLLVPGEQHIFKTGLSMAIPPGAVALIWDRSGMAANNGVKTMAGVLDHTYRGEIGVVLMNLTGKPYQVKAGDRIAQMLIQPVYTAQVEVVDDLDETVRSDGAWGSSGR